MSETLELRAGEKINHQRLDELELGSLEFGELIDLPVKHTFAPGLYIREIFMPKGTLLTSKIHNTEHPFCILSGKCRVFTVDGDIQELEAGHAGITQPGTRRALYIEEDCTWLTYHVLSEEEEAYRQVGGSDDLILSTIENRIIDKRVLADGKTAGELFKEELEVRSLS